MIGVLQRLGHVSPVLRISIAYAFALIGGSIFYLLDMPAGWLSGATLVVAIMTLAGLKTAVPVRLRDGVFIFLGISMGAGVTPETIERLPSWPLSLVLLTVTVVGVIGIVQLYFQWVGGWDRMTAFFASVPGALSYVMALAIETDADVRKVALAQCIRLIVLVMIMPLVLTHVGLGGSGHATVRVLADAHDLAILVISSTALGILLMVCRVPGGTLNGAFLASAVLHGTGLVHGTLPYWLMSGSFAAVGMLIGSRFEGTDMKLLRETFTTSVGGLAVACVVSMLGAAAVYQFADIPFGQAVLAFAPGAIEAMTGLALVMDLDPAYVASHQLFRFFGMVLTMPAFLSWYERGHTVGK